MSTHPAGIYPRLHLNIADNLRRLGAFDAASEHIQAAHEYVSDLPDDVYGNTIGAERRPSAPTPGV